MSQQMSRLAGEDPNRYEAEAEQVNRKISVEEDQRQYETPEDAVASTEDAVASTEDAVASTKDAVASTKDAVASTRPQSLPDSAPETPSDSSGFSKWQTVIWREWSRCEDDTYAYYLFDLIKNTTFGWKLIVFVAVLGTLLGALLGYAIGAIMARGGLYFGPLNLTNFPPILLGLLMAITGGLIGVEGSRRFRALYFWWQGQPSASLVERSLHQAIARHPAAAGVWAEPLQRLAQEKKQPVQPEQLIKTLGSSNWRDRFVAQKALVAIGGAATPALQEVAQDESNPLQKIGLWLLSCIEQETANKFAWRTDSTICPRCLTRFDTRSVEVGVGVSFTYYGCRICGQSRDYLYLPRGVVAILDASSNQKLAEKEGRLRVNWSADRALFDFDWVVIAHATDEDVERFAVQVGNDTDPWRSARYRQMQCIIVPDCRLYENTLRVLRHTFGQVNHAKRKAHI